MRLCEEREEKLLEELKSRGLLMAGFGNSTRRDWTDEVIEVFVRHECSDLLPASMLRGFWLRKGQREFIEDYQI